MKINKNQWTSIKIMKIKINEIKEIQWTSNEDQWKLFRSTKTINIYENNENPKPMNTKEINKINEHQQKSMNIYTNNENQKPIKIRKHQSN